MKPKDTLIASALFSITGAIFNNAFIMPCLVFYITSLMLGIISFTNLQKIKKMKPKDLLTISALFSIAGATVENAHMLSEKPSPLMFIFYFIAVTTGIISFIVLATEEIDD